MNLPQTIWDPYDPEQTIDEFRARRRLGIGGSDIADALDVGDYACRRRLFLDKLGLLPEKDSHHLERGRFLEHPVSQLYAQRTGRRTEPCGTAYLGGHEFIRANPDRIVWGHAGQSAGVLEIKCPAAGTFRKVKREGLLESWILQIQYQMLCTNTKWASVAVYWADGHELEWFDIPRDHKLCEKLFERACSTWSDIQNVNKEISGLVKVDKLINPPGLPEKKDEHSKACANCPAFLECHGSLDHGGRDKSAELQQLEPLVAEYQAIKEEEKSLEARKSEVGDAIKSAFEEGVGKIKAGKFTVSLTRCQREGFDSAQAKKDLPESVIAKYVKLTHYDRLVIKEQK